MHVHSLACIIVKGVENEWLRIDSAVRQGCIMSSWLFDVYKDAVMKDVKIGMGRVGGRFLEEGKERRLLLYITFI